MSLCGKDYLAGALIHISEIDRKVGPDWLNSNRFIVFRAVIGNSYAISRSLLLRW